MAAAKKAVQKENLPVKTKTPLQSKNSQKSPKSPAQSATQRAKGDVTAEYEAALEQKKHEHYVLRLYIAGNNLRSQIAVENVKKICEEYLRGRYELDVVDIYQDRSINPVDLVLAAPTLIRKLPLPLRRVIGDMTRKEKVLVGLDLLSRV